MRLPEAKARPVSPAEALEREMKAERDQVRREQLAALLDSPGWREVLRPALAARMGMLARQVATASESLDHIRRLQGTYRELEFLAGLTLDDLGTLFPNER